MYGQHARLVQRPILIWWHHHLFLVLFVRESIIHILLAVVGPAAFMGNIDTNMSVNVGLNVIAQGEVARRGLHVLSRKKNFDIPHPSKKGWRLRHTCPEAPTNDVYIRGTVKNEDTIELPSYWKDFVDQDSITVSLTPIGSHQNVIVKRIDKDKIYLQSQGLPIHCFYHVYKKERMEKDLFQSTKVELLETTQVTTTNIQFQDTTTI